MGALDKKKIWVHKFSFIKHSQPDLVNIHRPKIENFVNIIGLFLTHDLFL